MPRNFITKEELKCRILRLKYEVDWEQSKTQGERNMAHRYLNYVLQVLEEYRG
tara:strand:+ start:25 stop:183 length:159 start_codon:yes stop_codon:yes gene_type:complete